MPSYKVLERGFYDGKLYDPNGKRKVLTTSAKIKKVPSWLEPIKGETGAEAKARQAEESKKAEEAKKKAEEDLKEIESATFIGASSKATETL